MSLLSSITFRRKVRDSDCGAIRNIVESSGFFNPGEVDVAVELVFERVSKGVASGYHFVFAECDGQTVGYSCFGPIPCTASSFDLYWIAVHDEYRGKGLGRNILKRTEELIKGSGGSRIYVETSSREQYEPSRSFYESCGYRREAELKEFYAPGDDKIIYVKSVW